MFTGIVETLGRVVAVSDHGTNKDLLIASSISADLKADQSVSHNGVCLTVTKLEARGHWVTAVEETLSKSALGDLKVGDGVNLERSLAANGRLDGHIVQGHVDLTAVVRSIRDLNGSWRFDFEHEPSDEYLTVEKGSISVQGVSLTCFNSKNGSFSVAIIPHTFAHTTFGLMKVGDRVNLEFDVVGKYIRRILKGD